ncbi:hypothetical protein ABEB36_010412 [Hypothenemus hampei]|uniref:Uncharacterized protein n=1 Tax=Hypothenemus hampei TaxID=57062 RepID=A0ABD1EJL1_HYPHA
MATSANEVKPLYSTCVAVFGLICFVVGTIAVRIPIWSYLDTLECSVGDHEGYFGPWKTCKFLLFHRERCGDGVSLFQASRAVYISGVIAIFSVILLAIFCFLSVLQLIMINRKKKVIMKYSAVLLTKVVMAFGSALLAIAAVSLFATQTDDERNGFQITRGPAFYIEVLSIILNSFLFVMALYDMSFARREGNDPTTTSMSVESTTDRNPEIFRVVDPRGRGSKVGSHFLHEKLSPRCYVRRVSAIF